MIHMQRSTAIRSRLATIDADVAAHHARGDRTDVDELLDERLHLTQTLAILTLDTLA